MSTNKKPQKWKLAGSLFAARRKELNLTQLQLAEAVGYGYVSMISQFELGASRIPPAKLEHFARLLHLEPRGFAMRMLSCYHPEFHALLTSRQHNAFLNQDICDARDRKAVLRAVEEASELQSLWEIHCIEAECGECSIFAASLSDRSRHIFPEEDGSWTCFEPVGFTGGLAQRNTSPNLRFAMHRNLFVDDDL